MARREGGGSAAVPRLELRAWFAVGVLVFSLGTSIRRYVTLTASATRPGGDPWMAGEWLINYAGGFVRRGLFGELFLRLAPGGTAGLWTLLGVQVTLYLVVLAYCLRALHRADYSWSSIALICGPAALAFVGYVPETEAAFRKELLSFVVLALLAWSRGRDRSPGGVVAMVLGALGMFVVAVFSWEASALVLPAIGYLLLRRGAPHPRLDLFRWSAAVVFVLVAGVGGVLSVVFRGDPATSAAICDALRADGFAGPYLCSGGFESGGGAIEAIGWTTYKTRQDLALALSVYIGYLPLFALALLPVAASTWFRRNWPWALAIIVGIAPLYFIVTDYGRWTHLLSMALMFCITADDVHDAFARFWNPLSGTLYVAAWGMPHWMGQAQFEDAWWPNVSLVNTLTDRAIAGAVLQGTPSYEAGYSTLDYVRRFLFEGPSTGIDSWMPMTVAMNYLRAGGTNLYQDILLNGGVKFQYFPTSLLLIEPAFAITPGNVIGLMNTVNWLLVVATGVVVFKLLVHLTLTLREGAPLPRWGHTGLAAAAVVATLSSRTVLESWDLGQAQTQINFLCALALYAYVSGRRATSGVALALAALIKPQLGLFLIWGLVRKEWKFSTWIAGTALAGVLVSIARYGLQVHLDYLPIMSYLSRHGESYYPNQTVNGLLHRWFRTNDFLHFEVTRFAPFDERVYLGTMIATLLLVALGVGVGYLGRADAAAQPHDPRSVGAGVDFGLGLACFTMASPIAWDHHYGVLLAAYVVTAAAALQLPTRVGLPVLTVLAVSFFLTGSGLYPYFFPFTGTPANLLLSYVFFGAVLLIGCMLVVRFSSGGYTWPRRTPRRARAGSSQGSHHSPAESVRR